MSSEAIDNSIPTKGLFVGICLAGMLVGGACGALLILPGLLFGLLGGLVAGLVWAKIMLPKAQRADRRLMRRGLGWGVVVGLLAMAILHAGVLIVAAMKEAQEEVELSFFAVYPAVLVVGLAFAVVGGLLAGGVCGWMCQRVASTASIAQRQEEEARA